MIDESSLIWPESSEDMFASVKSGSDELITSNSVDDTFDKETFIIRKGLCGRKSTISIESKLYPGKFWRHQSEKIKLNTKENTDVFQQDSCFTVVRDQCGNGSFALQSVNNPDKFIQTCGSNIELRKRSATCGEDKTMCWVNPVSLQASLAYCATSVTSLSDVLDHPECCDHEDTVAEYGGCCLELMRGNKDGCYEKPYVPAGSSYSGSSYSGSSSFLLIPLFKLHYCLVKVRSIGQLSRYPQCCMYPTTRRIPGAREQCCRDYNVCGRKKRQVAGCSMPCWKINFCPMKMLTTPNWTDEDKYPELKYCCCHPFRKNVMVRRKHSYHYNKICNRRMGLA